MIDDSFIGSMEASLKFVGELSDQIDQLAYALYRTLEGDDVDGFELLQKFGYTDENDEWIEE